MKISKIPGLLRTKKITDERIQALFVSRSKELHSTEEMHIHENLREFSLRGGKRLRPFLLLLGYRFSGGEENDAIYDIAVALEIMHTAALIHDDYIDNDTLRRGKPTFHLKEKTRDLKRTRAHEGGNILMGMGMELLAASNFSPEIKVAVIQKFSKRVFLTAFGEGMDLFHSFSFAPGRAIIKKILKLKTAQYTASGPLTLGSFFAGGSEKEQRVLESIGENIGIAFQLADDALGATGTNLTGKNIGSDFREAKPTYLLQQAWKNMSSQEKLRATSILKAAQVDPKELFELRHLLLSKVSVDEVHALAQTFVQKAKKMIESLPTDDAVKQDFLSIAEFATERAL